MRPAGGLRTRAALGAVAGVLAAVLIVGIVLATQSAPDGRGGLAGTLILAALVGGALAAGLTAYLMNREVRALRQVWRSTESLLSPEGVEPFPRTGGPEIQELTRVISDTTDALQAESRALEHDHARLETVLASMTDGVVIVEADTTVSLVNQAAADMLNVRARMEGQASLADALRDNDLVEFIRAPAFTEQSAARLLTVGATEREVHAIAVPLGVPGLRQRLVLLRDLTDLRQTETVRRDFVANVSHELRTPLTALRALVETLQDGAADDPESRSEFLHGIGVEVERMSQIIAELLDLARIESGMADLDLALGGPQPGRRSRRPTACARKRPGTTSLWKSPWISEAPAGAGRRRPRRPRRDEPRAQRHQVHAPVGIDPGLDPTTGRRSDYQRARQRRRPGAGRTGPRLRTLLQGRPVAQRRRRWAWAVHCAPYRPTARRTHLGRVARPWARLNLQHRPAPQRTRPPARWRGSLSIRSTNVRQG